MKLNKENSFQFLNVKNGRIVFFLRECSRINLTIYIILLLKNILKVMVDTLTRRKIENPTPIQMQVIIFLGVSARSCYLSVFMFLFGACPFVSSFVLLFFFVLICPILSSSYLVSVSCSYSFRLDFMSCNKFCLLFHILQLPSESRKQKCCGSGSGADTMVHP